MRPHAPRSQPGPALALAALTVFGGIALQASGQQRPGDRLVVVGQPPSAVASYGRFEVDFNVDTDAAYLHWPFDAAPPPGIPPGAGVSAGAEFVDPQGRTFRQPAFMFRVFEGGVREGRDWHYPTPGSVWKVRFAPNLPGGWRYRLTLQDRHGVATTDWRTFTVEPSSSRGFVRVSRADSRYFEFDDGTFFTGLGFQVPEYLDAPATRGRAMYRELGEHGINFARLWVSSLYGSAWVPYVGGRNRYSGYLPVAGLMPFIDEAARTTTLTMRMSYGRGDPGFFDPCRLEAWNFPLAVKPNRQYRVAASYRGRDIQGPRLPRFPNYGFVLKLGGAFTSCQEPQTSRVITGYGRNTASWAEISGTWDSGSRSFLPKLHLALENTSGGGVFVRSVSVRERLPDGNLGAEILDRPSMEYHLQISEPRAHALDDIVEAAGRAGVYLKLVVLEKGDEIYQNLSDDGGFVTGRPNRTGIYGLGRTLNHTRWLQQAWWRYLQARWGYSPAVHSWELLNEGDPASQRHFELTDEFGKYMHFGVFGETPRSGFDHPNDHMVTTSFWHSFPVKDFWANAEYPHVDYADIHAYVSTSFAPAVEKELMQGDAAYYHLWHSRAVAEAGIRKPVVRGEAGLDTPGRQDERLLGIQRDRDGVWLHNFLWAGLDSGALYELYWWRSHIQNPAGDHRPAYRRVSRFLSALDLNRGGYADWAGTATPGSLRVVGQKNAKTGRMHLWIQNTGSTWKAAVERQTVAPVSGTVRVPGFGARREYDVEWWDTWKDLPPEVRRVRADAAGKLELTVDALTTDLAVAVRPASQK